ncbi:MAG: NADH-quinone oxidoreductase subunit H [Methanocalculus sp.]|uniref:respiratory chain complex I subunit 1 family protein n=1 Tax=Methanocalculus sp. TaxID=2004547 RepID=UPI002727F71D|nr:complex I subunit 1 family protein [Methanocalculus sp.]MDO9540493.1 NADH-quinone oxidoreductase subunit H [Methanocalculus sp.]
MIDAAWLNPGIAFIVGILLSFKLRKISARVQSRRGPLTWLPACWHDINKSKVLQPLYDILKLFSKQTIIPHTATPLFIAGPYLALACAIAATLFVPVGGASIDYPFSLVILFYLLLFEILFIIVGGISSASPFAAIGGVRETELLLANEIPFILGTFALAITYGTLSIKDMMGFNLLVNPFAALAVLLAILVKLHMKPFDIPEADSEIVGGLTTEYSGKLLGVLETTKMIMVFVLCALFADLFLWVPSSGIYAWAVFLTGLIATCLVLGIINSLFARFRIDQATRWLFKIPLLVSVLAIGWAVLWRYVL